MFLKTVNFFIEFKDGAKIYIDNELAGETPFLIKKLNEGEHTLRIETEEGVDSKKIIVKKDISDVLIYKPVLAKYGQKVSINSNPENAEVILDDNKSGNTPLKLDNIETGFHKIVIKLEGYIDFEDEITVTKDKPFEKNYELEKGYSINFKNKLPEDTIIKASKDKKVIKYLINEKKLFEKGNWKVKIISDDLKNIDLTNDVTITDKDAEIDFIPEYKKNFIKFWGLKTNSEVFLDDKDITKDIKNNSFETELGHHKIKILKEGYEPLNIDVNVKSNKDNNINIDYIFDMKTFNKSLKPVGIGLSIPGGLLMIAGISMFSASLGSFYFNGYDNVLNYTSYLSYKNTMQAYQGVLWAGVSISIIGLAMIGVSIPLFIIKSSKVKNKTDLSLNIECSNNINLCFELKL